MMTDYRALGRYSRATLRTTTLLFAALIPSSASTNAAATAEALLLLPSGGAVGLSTRGASAFRIRFLPPGATDTPPFVTPLIAPDAADAPFQRTTDGIKAAIGRLALSSDGRLSLFNAADTMLVRTQPLHLSAGPSITFDSSKPQRLYGRGGGPTDGAILSTPLGSSVTPGVENLEVLTPYYWSSLGYSALGEVNSTRHPVKTPDGGTNVMPAIHNVSADGLRVAWSWPSAVNGSNVASGSAPKPPPTFQLYLMPTASSLDLGTSAYYSLIGSPLVPPRWVFGFTFCRWGWTNRTYIDNTLHRWRSGKYPSDAFIMDFGWFTHVSDYSFPPKGFSDYHDFGYNNVTLPDPVAQLKSYRNDLHYRFGGIRKPRLGNTGLLNEARSLGLMLPGGEGGGSLNAHAYAFKRNLNFSHPPTREWYNAKMAHYLDDGEQASKQAAHGKQHAPLTTPSLPSLQQESTSGGMTRARPIITHSITGRSPSRTYSDRPPSQHNASSRSLAPSRPDWRG